MRNLKSKLFILSILATLTMTGCSLGPRVEEIVDDTYQVLYSSELEETVNLNNLEEKLETKIEEELVDVLSDYTFEHSFNNGEEPTTISKGIEEIHDKTEKSKNFEPVSLVRVVDGDTIVVSINEEEQKVRMIGIDTPESVASEAYLKKTGKENTQEGIDASDYTKLLLENVDTVYLQKDKSDTDRYGRLLRYVWVSIPDDEKNTQEVAEKMVNGMLLAEKVAEPASYKPDTSYKDIFEDIYMNY